MEYLNSLNNKEIKRILKKTFKGYRNYFHFAVLFNYVDVAEVFLKHNANLVTYSLLKYAARKNLTEMICTFLQYTKDFGKVTNIIYEVIYNDNLDVIMFVIKKLECAVSLEVMLEQISHKKVRAPRLPTFLYTTIPKFAIYFY